MTFSLTDKTFIVKNTTIPFVSWIEEGSQAISDVLARIDVDKLDMSVLSSRLTYCD